MSFILFAVIVSTPLVVAVSIGRDRTTFEEHDPDDWP